MDQTRTPLSDLLRTTNVGPSSSPSAAPGVSLDALKRRLGETLRDTGALDQVKARLRAQFVAQLNDTLVPGGQLCLSSQRDEVKPRTGGGVATTLAHSLVAEHLVACGLVASASVFEPESRARAHGGLCSRPEILARLGVSPGSAVHGRLSSPGGGSLLACLVGELARPNPELGVPGVAQARCAEASTMTDGKDLQNRPRRILGEMFFL